MTTVNMQPGEHDLVTDLLGAVVLGLTLGLVDLTAEASPEPRETICGTIRRSSRHEPVVDRERE